MKIMNRLATLACLAALFALPASASDTEELEAMLQEFLANSSTEAAHVSFWAEDLIYTSSAGLRFGKADIMAGFDGVDADAEAEETPTTGYFGEEVDIRIYGDTAIVAFKLVGRPTDESAEADVLYYFNTGTFLKRDGVWKAIAWQATIIPPT